MKDENLNWINSLRVLATFSVIVLHVAAGLLYQYGSASNLEWWAGNCYDSTVRFCVPIFLMISGALIFSKTYANTGEYLRKRVLRILLPFLFWSVIYISQELLLKYFNGEYLSFREVLNFLLVKMKSGATYHMWYIYLIIGLYLFFPIIGKWLHNSNKNEIKYFVGIWLLTVIMHMPFVRNYVPEIDITYFSGFIGFPVLGYFLSKTNLNFDGKKLVYVLLILTGILITIFATYFATRSKNSFDGEYYSYLSPNVILVSAGVFLLFKDYVNFNSKIILFFSKYSYGTYLIHILVLFLLGKIGLTYNFVNPIIGIPVISLMCFLGSTFIVWGINKLPFGKYISG